MIYLYFGYPMRLIMLGQIIPVRELVASLLAKFDGA
jgi:hypothetical protein